MPFFASLQNAASPSFPTTSSKQKGWRAPRREARLEQKRHSPRRTWRTLGGRTLGGLHDALLFAHALWRGRWEPSQPWRASAAKGAPGTCATTSLDAESHMQLVGAGAAAAAAAPGGITAGGMRGGASVGAQQRGAGAGVLSVGAGVAMAVTEQDAAGVVAVAVAVAAPGGIATGEEVGALVEDERAGGSGSGRVEARGGSGWEGDAPRRGWTRIDGSIVLCPFPPRRPAIESEGGLIFTTCAKNWVSQYEILNHRTRAPALPGFTHTCAPAHFYGKKKGHGQIDREALSQTAIVCHTAWRRGGRGRPDATYIIYIDSRRSAGQ